MRKKSSYLLLLPLVLFISFACASSGLLGDKENETPIKAADSFYKMLMWKYYDRAGAFIHPEYLGTYEHFVKRNKDDLNITSYEIRELTPLETENVKKMEKMEVKVNLTFYRYPSITETNVETTDLWIKSNDAWFVKKDFSKDIFNTEN